MLCLIIVDRYKTHIKETNITNRIRNYYFDYLIKGSEGKNILINQKNYKCLIIYCTRYNRCKSMKILSQYYQELMGKVKEDKEKIFEG